MIDTRYGLVFLASLFVFLIGGCQPMTQPPKFSLQDDAVRENTTVDLSVTRVELDVFSGRPNPEWEMSDEEYRSFHEMLAICPSLAQTNMFDGLGYRGFIVHTNQPSEPSMPLMVTVYSGVIKVSNDQTTSYCQDGDNKMEKWLLEQSRQFVEKDLQEIVEASLDQ